MKKYGIQTFGRRISASLNMQTPNNAERYYSQIHKDPVESQKSYKAHTSKRTLYWSLQKVEFGMMRFPRLKSIQPIKY